MVKDQNPLIFLNGIDGSTGQYITEPLTIQHIAKFALKKQIDHSHIQELRKKREERKPVYGLGWGNPRNLAEAGWGIIFPAKNAPAIKDALLPLLEHRKAQATEKYPYYKEFYGPDGYISGQSKADFLSRFDMGPGSVNPTKVPYYLLIVGDPESVPYKFQYQLDVQYAVGRIYFDTLAEYRLYAENVVNIERAQLVLPHNNITFFAAENCDDTNTKLSVKELVKPLIEDVSAKQPEWIVNSIIGEKATKEQLRSLLGGVETPSLLFTATHGLGFPSKDPRQLKQQGALICQDWPGPQQWKEAIPERFYFSADDLPSNTTLAGLITFHFACYSGGTNHPNDFDYYRVIDNDITPYAFMARLPQRLLLSGALAVVGHIGRVWSGSFSWPNAGSQISTVAGYLAKLMDGEPIGLAFEQFNNRYAELSSELSNTLEEIKHGKTYSDLTLAGMWTDNNDARDYVIIGDPAVRVTCYKKG